jgi:hypothetical protein
MIAVHCRYAYVQAAYSAMLLLLCALLSLTMSILLTAVVLICRAIYTPSRLFTSYHDSITYAPIALQLAVAVVMPAAASQLLLLTSSLLVTLVGLVLAVV